MYFNWNSFAPHSWKRGTLKTLTWSDKKVTKTVTKTVTKKHMLLLPYQGGKGIVV